MVVSINVFISIRAMKCIATTKRVVSFDKLDQLCSTEMAY